MIRRHLLALVCVASGGALAIVCAFMVFNFVQLAQAQTFVRDFVRQAVDHGSHMPLPAVAPGAGASLSRDRMVKLLDRAQQIGPFVSVQASSCAVQTDAHNLCTGQLLACVVDGTGRAGAFEAAVAMCRGGDLAPYLLAASTWTLLFTSGDPAEAQDRSRI